MVWISGFFSQFAGHVCTWKEHLASGYVRAGSETEGQSSLYVPPLNLLVFYFLFLFRMSSPPVPLPAVPLPQITAPSTAIMGGAAAASESWPVWKLVVGGVGFAAVSYGIYSYFGLASGEEEKKGGGGATAQKGSGSSNATATATAPVDPQQQLFAGSDDAEPSPAPAATPATTPPSSIEAPLGPPPTSPQLFLAWRRASGIIHARLAQVFAQNGCAAGWDAAITMTTVRKTNKQTCMF